jgi:hypothetical protein
VILTRSNHGRIHDEWNECLQGITFTVSPTVYSFKHTGHCSPVTKITLFQLQHYQNYSPGLSCVTPWDMRSWQCKGQNTPPLSTCAVHAISNRKNIYITSQQCCATTVSHTGLWNKFFKHYTTACPFVHVAAIRHINSLNHHTGFPYNAPAFGAANQSPKPYLQLSTEY